MLILVDVDGVIGDFTSAVLGVARRVVGVDLTPEAVTNWDIISIIGEQYREVIEKELQKPGFCASIQPYPGSRSGIEALRQYGPVIPVTSPWHAPTWAYERTNWLVEYYDFDPRQIVQTSYKEIVQGDVLIDDKPENILKWSKAQDKPGLLWDAPYNQDAPSYLHRVYNWKDVARCLSTYTVTKWKE